MGNSDRAWDSLIFLQPGIDSFHTHRVPIFDRHGIAHHYKQFVIPSEDAQRLSHRESFLNQQAETYSRDIQDTRGELLRVAPQ